MFLSIIVRTSRQTINKDIRKLNITIQIDLIDIGVACNPIISEYTFFSDAHVISVHVDHVLGHKQTKPKQNNLNIFKMIQEKQNVLFSDHEQIKLVISNLMIFGVFLNTEKLNSMYFFYFIFIILC